LFNYHVFFMHYVLILYYSRHGAVAKMANTIQLGVECVKGIEARVRTVPEVSPNCERRINKTSLMTPPFVTQQEVRDCAALILGSPTRFGNMAAPLKYFIDSLSPLWLSGALEKKPAAVFSSTSTLHGGQESTLLTMMLPLLHLGMFIIGVPYSEPELSTTTTGGSPYGPTHLAGPNSTYPLSEEEKKLCRALGQRVAEAALKLSSGL
jgi:NAD(P)H dehydrogenase (quinone)